MRRYKEAQNCFTNFDAFVARCGVELHGKAAANEEHMRQRAKHKIDEEEGSYRFELMRKKFEEQSQKHGDATHYGLDCGSFTSMIEIRESPGKGRGPFSTKDVKRGIS